MAVADTTGHLAEAKRLKRVAESPDAKRAAYEECAAAIKRAKKGDPDLTNVAVGKYLGVSESWVRDLLKWAGSASSVRSTSLPFSIDKKDKERRALRAEQTMPTRRADKVKMAATLMQDDSIVAEAMQKESRAAVAAQRVLRARREADTEANKPRVGRPLEKLAFNIMQKCKEWSGHLHVIADDLGRLEQSPRDKEMVVKGHVALFEAVCDNLDTLGYQYPERRPHLELIEAEEVSEGA